LLSDGALTNDSGLMHSARVAEALDAMVTSIGNLAQMSERRLYRLLDPHVNGGLPAFLVHPLAKSGLNSGFMIHQYTAAALVGELRAACVPASAQSIPVGNGTEDHGAMSTLAARRAARAVSLAETVVAIELLGAVQAIDVRRTVDEGPSIPAALRGAWRGLRSRVPVLVEDRLAAADIEAAVEYVRASGSGAEGEADLWEQHEL
ncbi:MAG TPA: aromatic amino acid lyase, partial [Polyangiaceae bacterium]|nr:aromatic amino acid lyase [Polyangiaceae bacterium]